MAQSDLRIEFQTDITSNDLDFYVMIEDRLHELAGDHSDITGAAATLEQPAAGRETPHIFEANIVVYMRPNNVRASSKRDDPGIALRSALDAVERQVREQREKLNEDRGSLDDLWMGMLDDNGTEADEESSG